MRSALRVKYERFREALVEARKNAGLTQSDVASELKQPQSYVSKYERGECRLDVIEFLEVARVIGFDPLAVVTEIMSERIKAEDTSPDL
jgi:transcriptional regulator with XRE-family HTH domain